MVAGPVGVTAADRYDPAVLDRLLFRRQFVLGPAFLERFPQWQRVALRGSLRLTAHPDLPVRQTLSGSRTLTLLGYILDPARPEASDAEILTDLAAGSATPEDLFDRTTSLGGRWILIAEDAEVAMLFTDATGQRPVYYTLPAKTSDLWCASDPRILAETLDLRLGPDALSYMASPAYRSNREIWWPGDRSPYDEIRHLWPNHALDLNSGAMLRFWPRHPLEQLSIEEAVARAAPLLRRLVASAHHRFNLAVSVSAGWDSRLLLASTKEISPHLYYFSYVVWDMTDASADVQVPARLLRRLGLAHHIIRCPPAMDPRLREVFSRSVATPHDAYGLIVQGLYDHYPQERVVAKGNASEIARRAYYEHRPVHPPNREISAEWLARRSGLGVHPFVVAAFAEWLAGAAGLPAVRLLDLFFWEQRIGNWQAMAQRERDVVQEAFSPYNCRTLLATLLSVNEHYRRAPDYILYRELTASLWPETLAEPVNPHKTRLISRGRMKALAKGILRRVGFGASRGGS